jgi:hypothetical protein
MADLRVFADLVSKAGLMNKPFSAMSREDVENIITAAYSAGAKPTVPTKFEPPRIIDGILRIPFNSDPKYHHWRSCGQSVFQTLRELGASDEVFQSYVEGPDDVPF